MESFEQTFGAKAQRKRPKVPAVDMEVTFVCCENEMSSALSIVAQY